MSIRRVQALLDAQLKTVTGLPTLQLENTRVQLKDRSAFCRGTINPAQSNVLTVGYNGQRQLQGIYQVDSYFPQDTGATAAHDIADAIVAAFPIGLSRTDGVATVRITVASVLFANSLERFFGVPVVIQWTAFA